MDMLQKHSIVLHQKMWKTKRVHAPVDSKAIPLLAVLKLLARDLEAEENNQINKKLCKWFDKPEKTSKPAAASFWRSQERLASLATEAVIKLWTIDKRKAVSFLSLVQNIARRCWSLFDFLLFLFVRFFFLLLFSVSFLCQSVRSVTFFFLLLNLEQ